MLHKKQKLSHRPTLESLLVREHLLSTDQVEFAQHFQQEAQVNFGTAVMFLNLVSPAILGKCLLDHFSIPTIDPQTYPSAKRTRKLIAESLAMDKQVFALSTMLESGHPLLVVAMTNPLSIDCVNEIEAKVNMKVQPVFVSLDALQALFKSEYGRGLSLFPPEITALNQKVVGARATAINDRKVQVASSTPTSAQYQNNLAEGLGKLLVHKGILSPQEWARLQKEALK